MNDPDDSAMNNPIYRKPIQDVVNHLPIGTTSHSVVLKIQLFDRFALMRSQKSHLDSSLAEFHPCGMNRNILVLTGACQQYVLEHLQI